MVRRNSGVILRQVHALLNVGTFSGLSDRQLLDRFLAGRDEVSELAFTVLVERHGPMVLGVCRRILVDLHDAEDAFQATFLVLVRKAGSVRVDGSVGRWLFGVATRVATRARADARRRRCRERPGLERLKVVAVEGSLPAIERADLQSILTEEIGRLPVRLQSPVILCDLEGSSYERAAQRLGWPVGTVKSRLSRARALLRKRLTRRGLVPDDLAITIPLLPMSLSRGLIETTTRVAQSLIAGRLTTAGIVSASVTTLTEGVLCTMFWTKFKLAIVATLLIMGGSAIVFSQPPPPKPIGGPAIVNNTSASLKADGQAATSEAAIDVEMLERAWAAAIPRRDAVIVNRIMADDFEGIDPIGNIFTEATYLSDLGKGVFTNQPIELDEIKTRIFGETAVVTSRIKIAGYQSRGRMTNVYVKRQGRWQCVASHASGINAIGSFCPGTTPSRDASAMLDSITRHAQEAVRPGSLGNNCMNCHMVTPHVGSEPPRPDRTSILKRLDELTQVQSPFVCRVDQVFVKLGQTVKKGDPLLELFSKELVEAKGNYEMACSQWTHDKRIYDYKAPLAETNTLARKELIEVENNEAQSRLRMKLAKDKLLVYGLTEQEIKNIPKEDGESRARFRLRSSVDGQITRIATQPGKYYNGDNLLMTITQNILETIEPSSTAKPTVP